MTLAKTDPRWFGLCADEVSHFTLTVLIYIERRLATLNDIIFLVLLYYGDAFTSTIVSLQGSHPLWFICPILPLATAIKVILIPYTYYVNKPERLWSNYILYHFTIMEQIKKLKWLDPMVKPAFMGISNIEALISNSWSPSHGSIEHVVVITLCFCTLFAHTHTHLQIKLKVFLDRKVREQQLTLTGGEYQLPKWTLATYWRFHVHIREY